MDTSSPADNKDVKAAEKKQAFKEGAMDNTGKLPDAAQPPETAKKESEQDAPATKPSDQAK